MSNFKLKDFLNQLQVFLNLPHQFIACLDHMKDSKAMNQILIMFMGWMHRYMKHQH